LLVNTRYTSVEISQDDVVYILSARLQASASVYWWRIKLNVWSLPQTRSKFFQDA